MPSRSSHTAPALRTTRPNDLPESCISRVCHCWLVQQCWRASLPRGRLLPAPEQTTLAMLMSPLAGLVILLCNLESLRPRVPGLALWAIIFRPFGTCVSSISVTPHPSAVAVLRQRRKLRFKTTNNSPLPLLRKRVGCASSRVRAGKPADFARQNGSGLHLVKCYPNLKSQIPNFRSQISNLK